MNKEEIDKAIKECDNTIENSKCDDCKISEGCANVAISSDDWKELIHNYYKAQEAK